MKKRYHRQHILHTACRQKENGAGHGRRFVAAALRLLPLALPVVLGACDPVQIIEGSTSHVSIRYDGVANGLDQATALAQKSCASHGKTAKLRKTYHEGLGLGERFAFFDCV